MEDNNTLQPTSISKSTTIEELAYFWDTHSLADYEDQIEEVMFDIRARSRHQVALEPDLFARVQQEATTRGVSIETLINLWISERLHQNAANHFTKPELAAA